jgi:hypothetical protein
MLHGASAESPPASSLPTRIGAAVVVRLKRVLLLFAVIYAAAFLLWLALWVIGFDSGGMCHSVGSAGC